MLNFDMHEESFDTADICHTVKLCDVKTHKVFYRKLDFIYVEIAKFDKTEDELVTLYDKWLYVLKNLSRLESRPKVLLDKVFDRLFEEAEIAKFTPRELREYEDSRKAYRDLKNSLDTAKREGIAEGMEKGLAEGMERGLAEGLEKGFEKGRLEERRKALAEKQEIARQLLATGMTAEQVSAIVGLPLEEVQGM